MLLLPARHPLTTSSAAGLLLSRGRGRGRAGSRLTSGLTSRFTRSGLAAGPAVTRSSAVTGRRGGARATTSIAQVRRQISTTARSLFPRGIGGRGWGIPSGLPVGKTVSPATTSTATRAGQVESGSTTAAFGLGSTAPAGGAAFLGFLFALGLAGGHFVHFAVNKMSVYR